MDFALTPEQKSIVENVSKLCDDFDDSYWIDRDEDGQFPHEFHRSLAAGGWLGITMPEEFGGSGLGVVDAALMMHAIARSGGGMTAASSVHINLFGPHPIVVFGTEEQRFRWLPALISGENKVCFGVTEANAGLDTTNIETFAKKVDGGYQVNGQKVWTSTAQVADKIMLLTRTKPKSDCQKKTDGLTLFYTDFNRDQMNAKRIPKMGRKAVDSNLVFIDDLFVPEEDRIGEEGRGFSYLLHSLNPERILIGIEAVGIGQDALSRAARYAHERVVFGRPIGKNQGIQHPLAEKWAHLEAAYTMCLKAGWIYEEGLPCGTMANAAKLLGSRSGYEACFQAVLTHGGMGYAKEYTVERLLREVIITRLAPISEQLLLSNIAESELDLPKSY